MPKRSGEGGGPTQKKRRSERFSAKNKEDAEQGQECKLFALPAELRNSIYEMVLIQDTHIEITANSRVPALLQVSRQMRVETFSMWLTSNFFAFTITDCDASLLCAWERALFQAVTAKIMLHLEGKPNWTRLMAWCKEVCGDRAGAAAALPTDSKFKGFIVAATGVAWRFADFGGSWTDCEKVLGELRHSAALEDADWLL
ncbi:hypothetical protein LTR56_004567 [Elasticomyces elasticus]|nr:hypothetical protein LTR56_004567 [Elasticomyces elasticus]KAK3659913.1 hypothetical protein LTR22_008280 [Elasticomyces elasticus]KAK4925906.1 hypothetical protein LTR49_007044 [Elasticomyces elasticus]KAK5768143.1 hypothetical protein LTS12_001627 [Elasticomyces elasticus]